MESKGFWKGILVGFILAACAVTGGYLGYRHGLFSGRYVLSDAAHVEKIKSLEELIDRYYLEEKDPENLAEGLYAGLLYGLGDPYSRYYTADEYEQENSSNEGSYTGIGALMQKNRGGGVEVKECYEGGPAKRAGVKEGDIISAIDGEDITDTPIKDVVALIKKSGKESVVLTVHRENVESPMEIRTEITDVELPSVFHEMLDQDTGYIQITAFNGNTVTQYKAAFSDLKSRGMNRLVIDLRDNPGGLLNSVCDILREILPEGLIVYTEDKYKNREEFTCDGKNPLTIPLAVLVNEGSASASEIFAGAVKDYGTGVVVGTTTYGKGVVQSIHVLPDGSAVKITVSRYYTPGGNNIHGVGIEPDVEVKLSPELLNREDIPPEEDNQLQTALEVLNKNNIGIK